MGATVVSESIAEILRRVFHNNMPVYHVFAPFEYLILTFIYRDAFTGKIRKIITYAIIPVVAFALINSLFIQKINEFPSNFLLCYQVIFLFYAMLGFRQMLLDASPVSVYKQSFFWLNIALMLFSTTLFLYFGLLNYSIRHNLNTLPLFIFSQIVNIIYYILLTVAIIVNSRREVTIKLNEEY